jgi:ankyrin repeat protein
VAHGANVNARLAKGVPRPPASATMIGTEGTTPFLMAADRADVPLMRELLKAGADPLLPNAGRTTPLMAAAGLGTSDPLEEAGTEDEALEATKMLLDLGADINAVDDKGDTAMHGAGVRELSGDRAVAGGPWCRRQYLETARRRGQDTAVYRRGLQSGTPSTFPPDH